MADETETTSTNPYVAMRAAKIARNQARLKELGLLYTNNKPAFAKPSTGGKSTRAVTRRKKTKHPDDSTEGSSTEPRRRSLRISGLSAHPDYVESKDFGERRAALSPPNTRQRGKKRSPESAHERKAHGGKQQITEPSKRSAHSRQAAAPAPAPTAAAANSVRTVSLDVSVLVQKFLATPMDVFGKYFVIESSFNEAAYPEDQQRLDGVPRLSFNKFSGVQPWKNVVFLWINVGGPRDANSLVNEFTDNGSRVTWFGGSKMTEDSPVIQTLIRMGKEAASTKNPQDNISIRTSFGIVLWCRQYNWETKKLLPYTCLGRLAYESHIPGSYPVAFTWRLMDHESMIGDKGKKKVFDEIIITSGSE